MRMPRAYDHVSQTVHDFDACFFLPCMSIPKQCLYARVIVRIQKHCFIGFSVSPVSWISRISRMSRISWIFWISLIFGLSDLSGLSVSRISLVSLNFSDFLISRI